MRSTFFSERRVCERVVARRMKSERLLETESINFAAGEKTFPSPPHQVGKELESENTQVLCAQETSASLKNSTIMQLTNVFLTTPLDELDSERNEAKEDL